MKVDAANEEALLLHQIVEHSERAVAVWRENGDFLLFNPACVEMMQRSSEELSGMKLWEAAPGITEDVFHETYREARDSGPITRRIIARNANGREIPIELRFYYTDLVSGGCLIGYARSVIAEIEEERLNGEIRRWLDTLFRHSPIGISIRDQQGLLLQGNPAWRRIIEMINPDESPEYDNQNAHSEDCRANYSDTDWDRLVSSLSEGKPVYIPEVRLKSVFPGRSLWVSQRMYVIPEEENHDRQIVTLTEDITDRKLAEIALRENEQRLKFALEGAGDGIWDWNRETGEFYVSPRYKEMLGYDSEEKVDFLPERMERVHPDDRRMVEEASDDHWFGRTPFYSCEYRIRCKNGEYKWILDRGQVRKLDADGKVLRIVGSHTDITTRKSLELKLKQSETLYRTLFESSGIPLMIIEPDTTVSLVNQEYLNASGFAREDVEGYSFLELLDEEYASPLRDYHRQRRLDPSSVPGSFDMKLRDKNGVIRDCTIVITMIPETLQSLTAIVDVTESRRMEKALRDSETLYRTLFESTSTANLLVNPETMIVLANNTFAELTHLPLEDVLGKICWTEVVHPDDLPGMLEYNRLFWNDTPDLPRQITFRLLQCEGEPRHCLAFIAPVPGAMLGIVSFVDITAQTRAEEDLRRSEQLFRSYFELPLVGIAITDRYKRWIQVNDKLCDILGYTKDELLHMTWEEITHPEDLAFGNPRYAEFTAGKRELVTHEKRYLRKDGCIIHVRISGLAVLKPDQSIDYIISLIEDISAQKRAEGEKTKLEAQLRQAQKMEAIGTLAGGIAHDFNNILTSILGFVELTMMVLPETSRAYDNLDHVLKGLDRARELISQILSFSRQTEHEFRVIDVGPVVKETLKLLRASLPSTVRIENRITPDCPRIMGDPTQIQQVLMNLCTNAHHAMKEHGGVLTVAVEPRNVDNMLAKRLSLAASGDYLRITISDTGSGMDAHTLERIFDPFFTTKSIGEGTGLGLSIVHGIIAAHRGAITVYSEIGVGSTFHMYFPCTDAVLDDDFSQPSNLPIGVGRILLVDDENEIIQMTVQMLELLGYSVDALNSSQEALIAVRNRLDDYDLVITDLTMPQVTGLEISRSAHEIRPELPIILTTGFSEVLTDEQKQRLGIRLCLTKPFDLWMLGAAITQTLTNK
jgi:PAS domain S-box-containing protein